MPISFLSGGKEMKNIKREGGYFLFEILLSLRGILRFLLTAIASFFTVIFFLILAFHHDDPFLKIFSFAVAALAFIFRYLYDRLLFKIKPNDMELWLKK